jgi:pimeloyl-ACP methyl ester carboxylesterase
MLKEGEKMTYSNTIHTAAAGKIGGTPSAQAWFAGGERIGYDPKARAIVGAQGDRLDFGRLFTAYHAQFPFLVGGSDEDPFEHRHVDLAHERLGKFGLQIERLPGGHLTTNEQPGALAALIAKFERGLSRGSRDEIQLETVPNF